MSTKFHIKALDEYNELAEGVRHKFKEIIDILNLSQRLEQDKFKKLSGTNLFELRVRENTNIFRAIGAWVKPDFIILIVFKKQSQKTPENIIYIAKKRYREIINY